MVLKHCLRQRLTGKKMGNSYFRFKQFTIDQEGVAMKVSTDACLFGAYMADFLANKWPQHVLDIGTGTGLLSLMIAQKTPAEITAVEVDEKAAEQAGANFRASAWHDRIAMIKGDIQKMRLPREYEHIICNPPYFANDLKSPEGRRSLAKHEDGLTIGSLLKIAGNSLTKDGSLSVLYPFKRKQELLDTAVFQEFYASRIIHIRHDERAAYNRVILVLCREKTEMVEKTITIKNAEGDYTDEVKDLLRDYYLYL